MIRGHILQKFRGRTIKLSVVVGLMILCAALAYSLHLASAKGAPSSLSIISNELEAQFNVTAPSKGNNGSTPSSNTEEITVIVDTGNGSVVSTATIKRTTNADGTKTDEVGFHADKAKEAVEKTKESGLTIARIVIPDPQDEVARLDLSIPKDAVDELARGGVDLEIYTDNAKIVIANSSLQDLEDDLYFRVIPIKDETERNDVEERARVEQVVKEVAGDNHVIVVARPMTIETNLTSRAVDIVLPLRDVVLPTDEQERAAFLADLVIFIEHSDGDRKLVKPEVVEYKDGQLGLKFGISKFSTFTILNMEGWADYINAQPVLSDHVAYMSGYLDQTFRPDRNISRAEIAMILYRTEAGAAHQSGNAVTFPDVASTHWAQAAIQYVSAKGLMVGFPDGAFGSERSITRAEMAVVVSNWLKLQGDATSTFTDIKRHWAEKEIALVQQAGIIKGWPDGSFKPDQSLTRAETVTMINKILQRGSEDWTASTWRDVPLTHWALKDIEEASISHQYEIGEDGSESIVK